MTATAIEALRDVCGVVPDGPSPIHIETAGRVELCQLFARLGFRYGAEVGVWKGHFSKQLCEHLPGLRLLCVDPWTAYGEYEEQKNNAARLEGVYQQAALRLRPYDCTLMRMTSLQAASMSPNRSLDFVYIDGNHRRDYVLADLAAWMPKIRAGGILAGHDYRTLAEKPHIQVKPAVEAFTRTRRIAPWFVLAADRWPSFLWMVS